METLTAENTSNTEPTVIIVDDIEPVRRMLKKFLENCGCRIVGEAESGRDAIDMARQLTPSIILMDYHLGDMTGKDALVEIIKNDPSAQIIIMTGEPMPTLVMSCMRAGAANFVSKTGCEELPGVINSMNRKNRYNAA